MSQRGKLKALLFENEDPKRLCTVYFTNVFNFTYCKFNRDPDLTLQSFTSDENINTEKENLVKKSKGSHVFKSSAQRVRICCKENGEETTIFKGVFKKDTRIIIKSKPKPSTPQDKSKNDSSSPSTCDECVCEFEENVADEEYIEAVVQWRKVHVVNFVNNSTTKYYVSFNGWFLRRTGAIFCVKPGESFLKVFTENISFKIRQNKTDVMKKKIKESCTITVTDDSEVVEKKINEEEDHLRKGLKEKLSFYKEFPPSMDHNLYIILGLKGDSEKITPKDIQEGYESKKEKKNSKYSKEEIEFAHKILSNPETRERYDEFYDFINEEHCFDKFGKFRWVSEKAWWFRKVFSPFSTEKTKEEKTDAWIRLGGLALCLTLICLPFLGPMIIPAAVASLTVYAKMAILFGLGYAAFAGMNKVFNDDGNFNFKSFLTTTIGHAIIGAGVGALFAFLLPVVAAAIPKFLVQHGVIGAATNCAGSFFSALLTGIVEKYIEKKNITWKDIVLNALLTAAIGIPVGFIGGLIFSWITSWALKNPTDEIVQQGVQVSFKQSLWRRFLAIATRTVVNFKLNVLIQSIFTSMQQYFRHGSDEMEVGNNVRDALTENITGAVVNIGSELGKATYSTIRNVYDPPEFETNLKPTKSANYIMGSKEADK